MAQQLYCKDTSKHSFTQMRKRRCSKNNYVSRKDKRFAIYIHHSPNIDKPVTTRVWCRTSCVIRKTHGVSHESLRWLLQVDTKVTACRWWSRCSVASCPGLLPVPTCGSGRTRRARRTWCVRTALHGWSRLTNGMANGVSFVHIS